jgi:hypothetical protein
VASTPVGLTTALATTLTVPIAPVASTPVTATVILTDPRSANGAPEKVENPNAI